MRKLKLVCDRAKKALLAVTACLARPWNEMKLNAEEIANRRRSRGERGQHNFLWCWQHRGFW
ncbi:hypothetical protein ACFOLL_02210 [Falsochrobactrum ovis]|uniref:hypothetical protein n=1 Tax=Falsochrobactrum ovis TaxID=1293442 RepID=UPI000DBA3600|nr:hypothetical protein [Falsochrobactrum ovis]